MRALANSRFCPSRRFRPFRPFLATTLCLALLSHFATAQTDKGPPRIRNVYIPQEDLEAIFGEGNKGTLMTRQEFQELWEKAVGRGEPPALPPADAVLTRARYDAELAEHELRVTARVQLTKLQVAWQTVELQFGGLAVESAKIDGDPARLGRNPNGAIVWVLHDKGRYELTLELSAPLVRTGGDLTAWLQLPQLPSSEFLLRLPEGKQVRVSGIEVKPETGDDRRTFRVPIDKSGQVPLAILDQAGAANRVPLVFVKSDIRGQVEPAGLRLQADVTLDVAAQPAAQFRFTLPASVEVAAVESSDLAGWRIAAGDDGRSDLTVEFRQPFQGPRVVRVHGLAPISLGETTPMPTIAVPGAVSHVGEITLEPAATLRLEISETASIRRLPAPPATSKPAPPPGAASTGPVPVPSPNPPSTRLRFAYWHEQFTLGLVAPARQRELSAALASLIDVDRTGLTLRTSITIEPRYAPLFDVVLELPIEWNVTTLLASDKPVAWETSDSSPKRERGGQEDDPRLRVGLRSGPTQVIRFDLAQPVLPGNTITVALVAELHPKNWLEPEGEFFTVAVPAVRLVGANEVEGNVIIESPRELEMRTAEISPDLDPTPPPPGPTAADIGTVLAYHYQDDAAVTGRIEARLRPAQISVETLAFAALGRETLSVYYQADLQLSGGQVRSFDFTLPAAVGEKIQITPLNVPVRVIEQKHSDVPGDEQPGDEKLFLWHVVLDRPVTGQLLLAITFELPLTEQDAKDARDVNDAGQSPDSQPIKNQKSKIKNLPVLAFRTVARQTGYIAVEAANDQEVEHTSENLREVDPADLPGSLVYQPGRIVAAYQFQRLPYQLRLAGERRDALEVLAAVCDAATITSVISREGIIRHQATYKLRSHGVQHLAVQLPAGANLWSVALDGSPIEVRRTGGKHIIPLPAGGANRGAGEHTIELVYETSINTPSPLPLSPQTGRGEYTTTPLAPSAGRGVGGEGSARLNRLLPQTIRQAAPVVNMTVLGLTWNVHLPNGTVLVSSDGDFKPDVEPTRPSLVAGLRDAIAENSVADLDWKFSLLGGAIIFGGVVWMFAQSRGVLVGLGVVGVIGLLIALLIPATMTAYKRSAPAGSVAGSPADFSRIASKMPSSGRWFSEGEAVPDAAPASPAMPPGMVAESRPLAAREELEASGRYRFDATKRMDEARDALSEVTKSAEVDRGAMGIDARSRHMGGAGGMLGDPAAGGTPMPTTEALIPPAANEPTAGFVAPAPAPGDPALSNAADLAVPSLQAGGLGTLFSATPAASSRTAGLHRELARLSLTMSLDTRGEQAIPFSGPDVGELVLKIQDDTLARTLQWLVTAATVLVAWLLRRRSRTTRIGWAAFWLLVPMGLSGLVPLAWTLVLDGLFVGGLCAIALWGIFAVGEPLAERLRGWGVQHAATTGMTKGTAATAVVTGLLIVALATSASAQTETAQPKVKTAAAKAKNVSATPNGAAAVAATASDSTAPTPPPVPLGSKPFTLYVPYDPKNGDPRESRWVYLPYDEFQRLWKLANPDKPVEPPPGVTAVVAEVGYEGRIDGDVARFDGRLVVYSFHEKWTRVALPLGNVALERVNLDGEPATLEERVAGVESATPQPAPAAQPASAASAAPGARRLDPGHPADDGLAIYVEKPGVHVVDVRFSVPLTKLGGTGRVTVPLKPAATGRLRFELPAAGLDVQIEGAPGGWRRIKGDEKEFAALAIGGAGELTVRWQPRREEAPANQLISVDQALLVDVQDSGIHLRGQFHYRVAQGAVRKLELRVPGGLAVRAVSGADVADWSVSDAAEKDEKDAKDERQGAKKLEIALKAETRTGTDIDIDAFVIGHEPIGPVSVRTLEPIGVTRETGRIVIGCSGQFHVRIADTSNLGQIERQGVKVPASTETLCELLSAFRYTARPWSLDLVIERTQPRLVVTGRTAVAITSERVTMHAAIEAEIGDSPLGSLRLRLPKGLRIARVTVPSGGDWFISRNGDATTLSVELEQPMIGKVPIELIGTLPRDAGESTFSVPVVSVAGAAAQNGQLAVVWDNDIEARELDSAGARSIAPAELTGVLKQLAGAPHLFAFQYTKPPEGMSLRLSEADSKLDATVVTTLSVREGSLAYLTEIDFTIGGRSRTQLQFTTPEWLGADIDVQGAGIRQKTSAPGTDAAAGRRVWTVTLQQPTRGKYQLHLVQILPLPGDGKITAAVVEPLETETVKSYVILENRSAFELTETSTRGTTTEQLAGLQVNLSDELRKRAISAHKVGQPDASLAWQRHEREQEKALPASVNLADLITVVNRDGTYRTQAAYVVNNRTRQFLEFAMPAESSLWAVYVAGQPVRPATVRRAGRDVTMVPLQKISVGDIAAQIVLVYTGRLGAKLDRWTEVTPPAPEILDAVPVARTLWTVYTPNEYRVRLVEKPSNMDPAGPGDVTIARDLAIIEEANELLRVAKHSGNAKAKAAACDNLKQIGLALPAFQRQATTGDIGLTADNRQWFRQSGTTSLSKQLELFCCPTDSSGSVIRLGKVTGKEHWGIVQQQAQRLQAEIAQLSMPAATDTYARDQEDVQVEGYFKKSQVEATKNLPELSLLYNDHDKDLEAQSKVDRKGVDLDEKEVRRGKLRDLNVGNVAKLKEDQVQTRALQSADQSERGFTATGGAGGFGGGVVSGRPVPQEEFRMKSVQDGVVQMIEMGQVAGGEVAGKWANGPTDFGVVVFSDDFATARAGIQSIDISIPLVGEAHHFTKLLGEPKLTLSARHDDVTRWSANGVWGVLCVALACVLSYAFSRPQVLAWFRRGWPWLAVVLGAAWLFLLPFGMGGLVLLAVGLSVLAWRTRRMSQVPTSPAST
jgi:hypothetical protein